MYTLKSVKCHSVYAIEANNQGVGIFFLSTNCVFRAQDSKILQDKSYLLHQMDREETLGQLCSVFLSLSGH